MEQDFIWIKILHDSFILRAQNTSQSSKDNKSPCGIIVKADFDAILLTHFYLKS